VITNIKTQPKIIALTSQLKFSLHLSEYYLFFLRFGFIFTTAPSVSERWFFDDNSEEKCRTTQGGKEHILS